ncbi:ABC transporter permease [Runella slithyformis]|uniref:ABC-type transporter, integral membrane subunit n=1 Tax=Runella slithyformis (strain ATCC 29530 / DSM 19594 / LMG 11500 / NCIMB 11436 / LSU 4) TaxID=761193 RepID=A0A7U3ZH08_RUNSL|nr:ABC transporter permease [Runella slithyformis]AEI47074.1 ABC-type transporter, integral membrane subunit [Runella slithyformis DSM 19594]
MNKYVTQLKGIGQYGIAIAFVLICLALSLTTSKFLTLSNWTIIITQVSINALLAFGVTFVIITGGIDLSLGSMVAVTGIVASLLAHPDDYPVVVPVLAGLLAGIGMGAFNGTVITKSKVPPFIVTLGTMTIGRGLALILSKGRPVSNLSDAFNFIGGGTVWGIPFPIIVLIIAFAVCSIVLKKTVLGRYIYAVGGNEQAAKASGIRVNKVKMAVYTICGGLAALAGILLTSRINTGQPNAGAGFELDAIAAAIIGGTSTSGGTGTMTGTLIGALLIGVISNGLDLLNVTSYYQQVVMGAIIIGAVVLDSRNQSAAQR